MIDKQSLVADLLFETLQTIKVGVLAKGLTNISPTEVVKTIATKLDSKVFAAIVGYGEEEIETEQYLISTQVEKAVLWRSIPEYAGKIVVFIKEDVDKLHSLAEFEVLSARNVTNYLIDKQISAENNVPTQNF